MDETFGLFDTDRGEVRGDFLGTTGSLHFGDPLAEALAARTGAGMAHLSFRGFLRIGGRDRARFLQGMLTADVAGLKEGEGTYAAALTHLGRMVADLRLLCRSDHFLADTVCMVRQPLIDHLTRFIIADDVSIEDLGDSLALLSLLGPAAPDLLREVVGGPIPDLADHHFLPVEWGGAELLVVADRQLGMPGFDLVLSQRDAPALTDVLINGGARALGAEAWNILRVEAGIPLFGIDMDADTIPLEANLQRALTNKGCYIGQEIIARITNLGEVGRRLVGLRIEGPEIPEEGSEVIAGEHAVGQITSAVFSPSLGSPIALAYVRKHHGEAGEQVRIRTHRGEIVAGVVALPFLPADAVEGS